MYRGVPSDHESFLQLLICPRQIYTQQKPFPSISNEYQVTAHVLAGGRPSRSIGGESYGAMSDALWEVVRLCWAGLPSERPSMSEILMAFRTTSGQWNTDPGVFQTYTITELPTRPVYATALSFMLFLHSIYLILSVSYLLSAPMEDGVIVVKRLVFVFFNLTLSFTFALAELMAKHLHLRNRTTHPSHSQIRGFSIAMISLLSWAFIFIGGAISTRDNTLVTAASMNLVSHLTVLFCCIIEPLNHSSYRSICLLALSSSSFTWFRVKGVFHRLLESSPSQSFCPLSSHLPTRFAYAVEDDRSVIYLSRSRPFIFSL